LPRTPSTQNNGKAIRTPSRLYIILRAQIVLRFLHRIRDPNIKIS